MSDPFLNHENPISGAVSEVIAGKSALNMPPHPLRDGAAADEVLKAYKADPNENEFLTDLDHYAKHAAEHFAAAIALLERASGLVEHARTALALLKEEQPLVEQAVKILEVALAKVDDRDLPKRWLEGGAFRIAQQ